MTSQPSRSRRRHLSKPRRTVGSATTPSSISFPAPAVSFSRPNDASLFTKSSVCSPPPPASRRGFSFVEVMFAVIILGIGFVMVSAMFPVAIQQTQMNVEDAAVNRIYLSAQTNFASMAEIRDLAAIMVQTPRIRHTPVAKSVRLILRLADVSCACQPLPQLLRQAIHQPGFQLSRCPDGQTSCPPHFFDLLAPVSANDRRLPTSV